MNMSQTLGISPEVIREHGLTPEEYDGVYVVVALVSGDEITWLPEGVV